MILLFVFFLFIFLIYRFYKLKDFSNFTEESLNLESLNSGDLFLVTYESFLGKIFQTLGNLKFIHPAMVLKKDNETYILEFSRYSEDLNGLILVPIRDWLKFNKRGKKYLNLLNLKKDYSNDIFNYYLKNKESFSKKNGNFINFLFPEVKDIKEKEKISCCEIILDIYYSLNILEKNIKIEKVYPEDFIDFEKFTFTNSNYFSKGLIVNNNQNILKNLFFCQKPNYRIINN